MSIRLRASLLAGVVVALATGAWAAEGYARDVSQTRPSNATASVPSFDHAVVIVFENKEYDQVVGNAQAPNFASLTKRGALLAGYQGVTHPSLPNYLALVSGSTQGITSDCMSCVVDAPSIADTLERSGRTWKTYAEGLPSVGFTGATSGRYAKKHNPFAYFTAITSQPNRLRNIVPLSRFATDLRAGRLPDLALVVPDLCHDMHDCSVATGDAWLGRFLRPLLASVALIHGAVFIVFDEGVTSVGGGGHVPALVLGPLVRPGSQLRRPLDHYDLLRTLEQSWRLPRLGRSAGAAPITGIWRSR